MPEGAPVDLANLTRVQVIGVFPIVSIVGYDEDGKPIREDVSKPGIANLDPAETNINALYQAGLVKPAPAEAKTKAKEG